MSPDLERLLRDLSPQVLGHLVRRYRDFASAEDALQEALLAAATQWPSQGLPGNPRAWLIQVASRRLTDQIRAESARRIRESGYAMHLGETALPLAAAQADAEDDTLALMFLCCHPSLSVSSAIALTLRAVGGLTTAEIARAFLVPESTMAQRISRAKQTIQSSGTNFEMPAPSTAGYKKTLHSVLHVLYLVFNEGYTASEGDLLIRSDLATEAIRLARILHTKLPEDPEVAGLLALMLLTDARRNARTTCDGEPIPLEKQDRSLWDRSRIEEGTALIHTAFQRGAVGPYQLQAAIAALHDEAPDAAATDWAQIAALYELLIRMTGNPMARLNHAVAVAMSKGVAQGLHLLDHLEATGDLLRRHYRFHAVRGQLREMAGDLAGAIDDLLTAAKGTASLPERNYLLALAARLRER
jgi:RNA polymerase sigma factor (sigma-70 family)